jgi:hypothetical protein
LRRSIVPLEQRGTPHFPSASIERVGRFSVVGLIGGLSKRFEKDNSPRSHIAELIKQFGIIAAGPWPLSQRLAACLILRDQNDIATGSDAPNIARICHTIQINSTVKSRT